MMAGGGAKHQRRTGKGEYSAGKGCGTTLVVTLHVLGCGTDIYTGQGRLTFSPCVFYFLGQAHLVISEQFLVMRVKLKITREGNAASRSGR